MSEVEKEIEALLEKLRKSRASAHKRELAILAAIGEARGRLQHCSHSLTETFRWEHDDGYGRQSMNDGLHCLLCDKRNSYPRLGGNSWY